MSSWIRFLPGLGLLLAIALPAMAIQHRILVGGKEVVSAVAIAIVLGIVIRNALGMPEACRPGVGLGVKRLLRIGIALMGAQLSAAQVARTGARAVIIVATCILLALLVVRLISLRMGLSERLGTLLGVGTCICGVSAIVATAPLIEAKDEETSLAVSTITVFGLLAVLVYPLVGRLLGLSDTFFGTWAGTAVNDTSQVVATGLIYSERAGEVATVVKLTRNLFLAPVIVGLSSWYFSRASRTANRGLSWRNAVPGFVLGFVVLAVLNSLGAFPPPALRLLRSVSVYLIVLALAGVGRGSLAGARVFQDYLFGASGREMMLAFDAA
ncbi:MAG: putative sulfate exporter family transporter, partial [Acidobacteria bacterium]